MKTPKAYYITTTIPYVNADPHIGFALEIVQADALARFYRLEGHEVFLNLGADEHGQKIWEKAKEAGEDTQTYVDRYAAAVKGLQETLNLSNDNFVRTTDSAHKAAAQELWRRCSSAGDIYKKKYKGLYCVGCEKFLLERDLVDGKCPLHPNLDPVELEEENYFFALSKYQDYLLEYLQKPDAIVPTHRLKEARQFVEGGLEDFSISREKEKLPWGVPVPGDDTQVQYVWFDALTNYISTLGWPDDKKGKYKKFWEDGHALQMAGKDQIRFQSIMWQAILKSAGLPPTDQVFYHGFITSGGQRMSKSLGNVISPLELVERYGTDATRYLLLRHVHPTDDTDITWKRLDEWYNAHLANGLGNLVARVMKMSEIHIDPATIRPGLGLGLEMENTQDIGFRNQIQNFRFDKALDYVWGEVAFGDKLIQEKKPFELIKTDPELAKRTIAGDLVQRVWRIGVELEPFIPETSEKILNAVKQNKKPTTLFPRID